MRTTREEITEIVREMPGVTQTEIMELMPHVPCTTVSSMLNTMYVSGEVVRESKPTVAKRGRSTVFAYTMNPDPLQKPPAHTIRKTQPTSVAFESRIAELEAKIAELKAWKRAAIERFPDLDVDPVVLEARKIVAAEIETSDPSLASQVRSGVKDNILPMRVTIAALNRAA